MVFNDSVSCCVLQGVLAGLRGNSTKGCALELHSVFRTTPSKQNALASIDVRCGGRRDLLVWSEEAPERKLASPSISKKSSDGGQHKAYTSPSKGAIVKASTSSFKPASKQVYNGRYRLCTTKPAYSLYKEFSGQLPGHPCSSCGSQASQFTS